MADLKHTPGPWELFERHDLQRFFIDAGAVQIEFRLTSDAGGKQMEANARLIAAAPELLEALLAFAGVEDFAGWHDKYHPSIQKARAAIAAATGSAS